MQRTLKITALLFLAIALFVTITPCDSHAFIFGGQSFAIPMEGQTTFGYLINKYFRIMTSELGGMYQFAFFVALIISIIRFGFGERGVIQDYFLNYLGVALLLVAPIFGGKALPIFAMDQMDHITMRIIERTGNISPKYANNLTIMNHAHEHAQQQAYRQSIPWSLAMGECLTLGKNRFRGNNPPNVELPPINEIDVRGIESSIGRAFLGVTVPGAIAGMTDCDELKGALQTRLEQSYDAHLRNFISESTNMGNQISAENMARINQLQAATTGQALMFESIDYAIVYGQERAINRDERGSLGMLWDAVTTREGLRDLAFFWSRFLIALLGSFFYYFFDHYIHPTVTIIKTMAAMGLAIGVLLFMFLWRLELVIGSLGVWMFGNMLYIVASIGVMEALKRSDVSLADVATFVAVPNIASESFFVLAFIGIAGTTLASVLTWKGIAFSMTAVGGAKILPTKGV